MHLKKMFKGLIVMAGLSMVAVSCASDADAGQTGSAEDFSEIVARSLSYDFDPFEAPASALRQADLVVAGVVADVGKGMEVTIPNPGDVCREGEVPPAPVEGAEEVPGCIPGEDFVMFSYLSVTVDVDKAFAGKHSGQLVVQVEVSHSDFDLSLEAFPRDSRVLLVMADETDWQFRPESERRWDNEPKDGTVWIPYQDGLFLEGTDGSFVSVYDHSDVKERWKLDSNRFDDLVAAFEHSAPASGSD